MLNKFCAIPFLRKKRSLCHRSWSNPLKRIRIFHDDENEDHDENDDDDNDDDDDDVEASHDRGHGSHPSSINWRHPTKSPHNTRHLHCIVPH